MLIKVVFPDPVKPTIDTNCPSSTNKFTAWSTSRDVLREVKDLETSRTSRYANSVAPLESQFDVAHHSVQKETHDADRENAQQNVRVNQAVVFLPEKTADA